MKVMLFANTDWYLYNFRRDLALALRKRGDEVWLLSPPGEYAARLRDMGFQWLQIPLTRRGMNPFTEINSIWRLYQLYRHEKPDLVHHFTVKCVLYGSLAAHQADVRAIVNSITGLGYIFLPGGFLKNALRVLVRIWYRIVMRRTQVIFENDEDRKAFLRFGFIRPADGHLISGVGVDTSRFVPVPETEGVPVALLAARMLWDKGVGEFVEAARLLHAEGLKARFVLVGRTDAGNPASISNAQIEDWHDEGVIEWWGWGEDMAKTFSQASIVCLPSYREGMPTVLIEAAACGRPIITTDVPGCRDTIIDGVTGLLVKVRDVPSLADALRILIVNPALRRKMGTTGRCVVEEQFSTEKITKQIFAVYGFTLERSLE